MKQLYRYVPVWSRTPEYLALYRCFEILGKGYCVQSKDRFRCDDPAIRSDQLDRQVLELLSEQAPEERSGLYGSLEAAIDAFEAAFV